MKWNLVVSKSHSSNSQQNTLKSGWVLVLMGLMAKMPVFGLSLDILKGFVEVVQRHAMEAGIRLTINGTSLFISV